MNWQSALSSLQRIAKGSGDTPSALVALRHEVIVSGELADADKDELHHVLDRLHTANLYGQIALVGQLKEVLLRYPAFKLLHAAVDGHIS